MTINASLHDVEKYYTLKGWEYLIVWEMGLSLEYANCLLI